MLVIGVLCTGQLWCGCVDRRTHVQAQILCLLLSARKTRLRACTRAYVPATCAREKACLSDICMRGCASGRVRAVCLRQWMDGKRVMCTWPMAIKSFLFARAALRTRRYACM